MFLKNLIIQKGNEIIREINFHKGVNFIVDETPESQTQQSTGNNVGKTTVLRLVDFCFGKDGKNIYQETEFSKQPKTIIENFLKGNNVIITLILYNDNQEIVIRRNFLTGNKTKILEINEVPYPSTDKFEKQLKLLMFDTEIEKPTFRQIISKNIRYEKNRISNIVKVLDGTSRFDEYETLYLFWLGVDFDGKEKQELFVKKRVEETLQKRLENVGNLSLIEQALINSNKKIEELNKKKDTFNLNENYSNEIDKLNEIKYKLNSVSSELGKFEMRKDLILESKEDLEKEYSQIDSSQIKLLYEKAQALMPTIQVSFESTLKFHNDLIAEKLKFITKELPELEKTILIKKAEIRNLTQLEKELTEKLQKAGITEDLEKIMNELSVQYEQKGKLEEQKRMWEESNNNLQSIKKKIETINEGIISQNGLIKDRISKFNNYFTQLSGQLYDEDYYLTSNNNNKQNCFDLSIDNLEGNQGTGKKKVQIAAFDFAYILFADSLGIRCLHFIMYDQFEVVHDNQLNTLFDIANNTNCQLIMPILRNRIPANVDVRKYEVLSLSQDNKLFKI